jgi:hypothetical protein
MRPIGGGKLVPEPRAAGLPDLYLLHENPPRLIFAELKDKGGKLSDEQAEFLRLARGLADAFRVHQHAVREVLAAHGAVDFHDVGADDAVPVGVYVWRPGDEPKVETILRSKVLS